MATLVLSALGAAAGASIGGGVLGLSSVVIGRALGAVAGRFVDEALLGGSQPVQHGKMERFRILSSAEGAAVPVVYGRMRVGGQVIWAGPVNEHVTSAGDGAGKGVLSGGNSQHYRYTVSLAVALCEGEIAGIGRIWADGQEISPDALSMRVYTGTMDQQPDPKMAALMGPGNVPAYRGTAYVLIEELDLGAFGNRVPALNFEVFRPEQPGDSKGISRATKAVAVIPGTGEYALATTVVHKGTAPGEAVPVNENTPLEKADFAASLEEMDREMPNLEAASLVVSWFGSDLRAGQCALKPKVEQREADGQEMPWNVSGLARAEAELVPQEDGRPVYGGTPTDQSVIEAIMGLAATGKSVTFYPFILMEQLAGNGLTDPWSGAGSQPALPWRGRITLSAAPGQSGSPDGTAQAEAEVAAFFGTAQAGDFTVEDSRVIYRGPEEWSYRRFILHYAHLCAITGRVDAFLIGSEMRALTQIRGANGRFPAVDALRQLAADVRAILGPEVKLSYAADWSEYFGYHPADGSGDLCFHLDPLWADPNIDFIGIDNYMPLSDWRDGEDHADAGWGSIYNLDYLKANILGGEGYDWYYHAPEAAEVQRRTPITDGEYDEPWVWRYKDIKSWWQNFHFNRTGGVRAEEPTGWVPGSKPIWFTELGCAAIDKGTNQPNKFLDPKSSESSLPKYSDGRRDDFIQMQYLRAMYEFWAEPENNPTDPNTGVTMLDMSRAHVWAWDARPFPWFPGNAELWSDGANYMRGHWLNGRVSNRALASVVEEICARSGVSEVDTEALWGVLRGYAVTDVTTARAALQPLLLAYGIEAVERGGKLHFFTRDGRTDREIPEARLALSDEIDGPVELIRAAEAEMAGRVRLHFTEADGEYETRATEAVLAGDVPNVSQSELPLVLTQGEGKAIVERWLAEARVARDRVRFSLPPSQMAAGAGDVVALDLAAGGGTFRIDRVEQAGQGMVQAVRVEPRIYEPADVADVLVAPRQFTPAVPVLPLFLDLPLLDGGEVPHAPHLAVTATPWPGAVNLFSSATENGFGFNSRIEAAARVGVTETNLARARTGVFDRGAPLRVRMLNGALASASRADVLNGANLAAIGDGTPGNWEIIQFADAELVGEGVWEISTRLRGQLGSDAEMPEVWPAGSMLVMLDSRVKQIALASAARGTERHYRIGPASRPVSDAAYREEVHTFQGLGLRPLSPVHFTAREEGADLRLDWIRRTRLDGDSWANAEVPLGEESERYQLRVLKGGALLREVELTSPGWTYPAAQRAADGASGDVAFELRQVSARFGPGAPASLSLYL
ncbi:MAG: host specificity protein [Rhodobacterales bacterium]|nr:MAG: host specificity protein [Rhodobacterales bacterium]